MPSCPRQDVVAKGEVGVYHCWNRCVQRSYLCGKDPVTGKDYEYRRDWIEQTEKTLAGLFAVDIAFHAELSNHIHLIVRTRPDIPPCWSDREVVRRWLIAMKLKRNGTHEIVEPTEKRIAKELKKPKRVAKLRARLGNVSWFMGTLCECISRRCNADSGTSGAFWEHRFECRHLADEAAILVCGIYVDLNQIRAGEAPTPEQSRHTSAYNRIEGRKQRVAQSRKRRRRARRRRARAASEAPFADSWLCELTLEDGAGTQRLDRVCSATPWRASDKGILSLTLEKYLALLDWTGRTLRGDKRGAIPSTLAPILERLGIAQECWFEAIESFETGFGAVVGSLKSLAQAAQRAGRRWLKGRKQCAAAFA